MKKKFSNIGLDWKVDGYFGAPEISPDIALPESPMSDPWRVLAIVIARSKSGHFDKISTLMDISTSTEDWLLVATCAEHLGDAGGGDCFDRIVEQLPTTEVFHTALHLCRALHLGGRLSDVPVMLETYEKFAEIKDADMIPIWIADLIGKDDNESLMDPPHHEDLEDYAKAVSGRYQEIVDQCGTEQAFVFRAARFGVVALAKYILNRFQQPFVRSYLRQKFEASTGIDCRCFYRKEEFRPLAASAVVEEFLESGASANYEDGHRYFFGHRIPN